MITRIGRLVGALALAAGLAALPSAYSSGAPGAGVQALPNVNMEAVVKAAQWDPRKPDTGITPGAGDSVRLVEQALAARGHLASQYVDGHFGTSTISAYAAYQRSLGYTGLDANGLPGRTSLTTLGTNRFAVINPISPGSRVSFRGYTLNTRTRSMILEAERLLGRTLTLTQGSYNPGGVGASAGTHDGGGAADISVSGMTTTVRTNVVRQLRVVGFAAWYRSPAEGDWGPHIHMIALSDTDQSTQARNQAGDYYLGLNGLANRGPDTGPTVTPIRTWEEYLRS
ncbi:MAG TPA: peptidoglycan-binding domain-containing protein [Pseudonocardiaceae bacterium]